MKITIHPAAFMLGSLLLCVVWLSLRTPEPMPFATAPRAAQAPRVQRTEIQLDSATLQRYRGEYRVPAGLSVFIGIEGSRLFALAPDTPRLELYPFSETEFFLKEIDAEVSFEVDGDGPAPRFTARFPTGTLTAKRVGH